jgi:2-methylcitrate dehydratase PrpD
MLAPADYAEDDTALFHPLTRQLMRHIDFRHGGPDYDRGYPDGLPTTVEVVHAKLGPLTSGLVMYPAGHARCESENLTELLERKVRLLAEQGVDDVESFLARFTNLAEKSTDEIRRLYDFRIRGVGD